jgi:hypothetical protein
VSLAADLLSQFLFLFLIDSVLSNSCAVIFGVILREHLLSLLNVGYKLYTEARLSNVVSSTSQDTITEYGSLGVASSLMKKRSNFSDSVSF